MFLSVWCVVAGFLVLGHGWLMVARTTGRSGGLCIVVGGVTLVVGLVHLIMRFL